MAAPSSSPPWAPAANPGGLRAHPGGPGRSTPPPTRTGPQTPPMGRGRSRLRPHDVNSGQYLSAVRTAPARKGVSTLNDLLSSRNHASRTAGARGGKLLPVLLAALAATLAMLAITGTASAAIPASFFTIVDQQGVNDVNSDQVDLTQMGRDDSDAAMYKLFWSWDSTSQWTGEGQTGDACALFDSDGDGNVNFAVCARIENPNADPTQAKLTADSPFLFSCDDSKNDRCAQPTQLVATTITAGTIGSGGTDRTGN